MPSAAFFPVLARTNRLPGPFYTDRYASTTLRIILLLVCCLMASCATPSSSPAPDTTTTDPADLGESDLGDENIAGNLPEREEIRNPDDFKPYWWYIRFRLNWPEDEAPDWTLDTLLADLVCAPALVDFGQTIQLWRFHRRAARDSAGRQFSFIFYTDAYSAQAINRYIDTNPLVEELLLRGYLSKVSFEQHSIRPNLEDTSDKNWSAIVQKSWPFFIMGVSETWLDLIEQVAIESRLDAMQDLPTLLEGYGKVSATIDEIWKWHGKHAFLHHLNAVFGYQPMSITY